MSSRRSPRSVPTSTRCRRPSSTVATASPSCSSRASTRRCPSRSRSSSLFAGTRGYLDAVAVSDVQRFETELLDWFRTRHGDLLGLHQSRPARSTRTRSTAAIKAFAAQFVGRPKAAIGSEPDAEAQADAASRHGRRPPIHLPEDENSIGPRPSEDLR